MRGAAHRRVGGLSLTIRPVLLRDQVDLIVRVDEVGDPQKITAGAIRLTSNPR